MTNKEKIKLVQENKAQLVASCKNCLNCKKPNLDVTDWDVMQSGYSDEQLYPKQHSFKDQIDFYWYGHSGEEELALWVELQKERIEGGACLTGNEVSMVNHPVQVLEVLEMHDVPCTTIVIEG